MKYKDGTREESYGLVQIHLPAHPTVSKEEAQDPTFSIVFLVEHIKAGKAKIWSCYRIVTGG
jgi:hypothetical protein